MTSLIAFGVALDCFIGLGFLVIWRRRRRERREALEMARRRVAAAERSAKTAQEIATAVAKVGENTKDAAIAAHKVALAIHKTGESVVREMGVAMSAFSHALTTAMTTSSSSSPVSVPGAKIQVCGRTGLDPHLPHHWSRRPDGSYGDFDDPGRDLVWCPGVAS